MCPALRQWPRRSARASVHRRPGDGCRARRRTSRRVRRESTLPPPAPPQVPDRFRRPAKGTRLAQLLADGKDGERRGPAPRSGSSRPALRLEAGEGEVGVRRAPRTPRRPPEHLRHLRFQTRSASHMPRGRTPKFARRKSLSASIWPSLSTSGSMARMARRNRPSEARRARPTRAGPGDRKSAGRARGERPGGLPSSARSRRRRERRARLRGTGGTPTARHPG